ncbi:hypothetical protein BY458DRAFT_509468 [Sporodiniella umbellata]|nr:hypothetical protein BY458DRAFT_509468 [Sporodiniella umbellata]
MPIFDCRSTTLLLKAHKSFRPVYFSSPFPSVLNITKSTLPAFGKFRSYMLDYQSKEEGNDFKRLLHKNRKTFFSQPVRTDRHSKINKLSPDYNSVISLGYLPPKRKWFNLSRFFSQHEDTYFNQSREELSKDIFSA